MFFRNDLVTLEANSFFIKARLKGHVKPVCVVVDRHEYREYDSVVHDDGRHEYKLSEKPRITYDMYVPVVNKVFKEISDHLVVPIEDDRQNEKQIIE